METQTTGGLHLPEQTRAVLFDLDDTLHHRHKAYAGWAGQFAHKYARADQQAERAVMVDFLITHDNYGYTKREVYFARVKQAFPHITEPIEDLIAYYHQEVIAHVQPEQEITLLLHALHEAHIPFGIVTNGLERQQRRKIQALGIDKLTNCIFISGSFGIPKPDKRIFLAAAQHLQVEPGKILFIGDHPRNDIWGASQAGMCTVWVQHEGRGWPDHLEAQIANNRVHGLNALPALFGLATDGDTR